MEIKEGRIRKIIIPNTLHHVTQRDVRSMNIFFKDEDYKYYKELLYTQTKLLKEKTRTRKTCRDDNFYDKIEILIGVNYKNKKAGRPKKEQ